MAYAFISDGRLFLCDAQGQVTEIESRFVQDKQDRAEQHATRTAWRTAPQDPEGLWQGVSPWAFQAPGGTAAPFQFLAVAPTDENTISYLITNHLITGLFELNLRDQDEIRLFHRNDFELTGLDYSSARRQYVSSILEDDFRRNLILLDDRGSYLHNITEGDSRDENPSFSRCRSDCVLYNSAGICRHEDGSFHAFGPEAVMCVDLDKAEVTEILADPAFDYLLPQQDAQGNVYAIRRPWRASGQALPLQTMFAVLLFPFHFAGAVVGFLQAFTYLFNQHARTPLGPAVKPPQQPRHVRVLGQTINLAKVRRSWKRSEEVSLVPASWQLIRRSPDGEISVLDRRVAGYALDTAGRLHTTNGCRVCRHENDRPAVAFRHNLIQQIRVLPETA